MDVGSNDAKLGQRLLPHVFALISGAAAYLSLRLFPDNGETDLFGVAATFALVAIPVLGAAVGSLIAGRRNPSRVQTVFTSHSLDVGAARCPRRRSFCR